MLGGHIQMQLRDHGKSSLSFDWRREQRRFQAVEKSPAIKCGRRHRCGCPRQRGEGSGGARVRLVLPLVRACGGLL